MPVLATLGSPLWKEVRPPLTVAWGSQAIRHEEGQASCLERSQQRARGTWGLEKTLPSEKKETH